MRFGYTFNYEIQSDTFNVQQMITYGITDALLSFIDIYRDTETDYRIISSSTKVKQYIQNMQITILYINKYINIIDSIREALIDNDFSDHIVDLFFKYFRRHNLLLAIYPIQKGIEFHCIFSNFDLLRLITSFI